MTSSNLPYAHTGFLAAELREYLFINR